MRCPFNCSFEMWLESCVHIEKEISPFDLNKSKPSRMNSGQADSKNFQLKNVSIFSIWFQPYVTNCGFNLCITCLIFVFFFVIYRTFDEALIQNEHSFRVQNIPWQFALKNNEKWCSFNPRLWLQMANRVEIFPITAFVLLIFLSYILEIK